MADQALTDDDQSRLLAVFEQVEQEHMGLGTHEKFLHIADALADRYEVARPAAGICPGCGCHHG